MTTRKSYTDEFKREAVRLAEERGNIAQTARDLGISDSSILYWKKQGLDRVGRQHRMVLPLIGFDQRGQHFQTVAFRSVELGLKQRCDLGQCLFVIGFGLDGVQRHELLLRRFLHLPGRIRHESRQSGHMTMPKV